MRSLGDLPKVVLILEGTGVLLLIVAYLSIHDYLTLPLSLASTEIIVGMIFLGILLMLPALACLVWRVSKGWGPLLNGTSAPLNTQSASNEDRDTLKKSREKPNNHEDNVNM